MDKKDKKLYYLSLVVFICVVVLSIIGTLTFYGILDDSPHLKEWGKIVMTLLVILALSCTGSVIHLLKKTDI